jgi:hypothetical protein
MPYSLACQRVVPTLTLDQLDALPTPGCQTSTVASNSRWGMSPQQSIERECSRRGRATWSPAAVRLPEESRLTPTYFWRSDFLLALGFRA